MKKQSGLKRIGILFVQHLVAATAMVVLAGLLLNSYIAVESIDGVHSYKIFSMDMSQEFEESDVYHDLFSNAVSDITQLVMIKEQLETDGTFDGKKKIDVSKYAEKVGSGNLNCPITANYELDDLIKWGKYGITYENMEMSSAEFIQYFGEVIFPENFVLDEYGQLVFGGFNRVEKKTEQQKPENAGETAEEIFVYEKTEELAEVEKEMGVYTKQELRDMVFSYIMAKNPGGITVSTDEKGKIRISVAVLNSRYATADGTTRLIEYADNWVDYLQLQSSVVTTIETLTINYQRYQLCNEAYSEDKTNVRYLIRMMTDEGTKTFTNIPDLKDLEDEAITEFFYEYRKYLIYYPDSLTFTGNTLLGEDEMDQYIGKYAYPDSTHIWMGMDTNYSIEGDSFYNAHAIYEDILPNVSSIIVMTAILVLIWAGIGLYLTVTAGVKRDAEGNMVGYLNQFDRIWSEAFLLLGAVYVQLMILGYYEIADMVIHADIGTGEMMSDQFARFSRYGAFGLYGIAVSAGVSLFWYSLVRRMKEGVFWSGSLIHKIGIVLGKAVRLIFKRRNSVITLLIPYNLFLFTNMIGIVAAYNINQQEGMIPAAMIVFGIIVFDCAVGVVLFKRNTERNEIIDGINKIRDGEVEFHLDVENLHGDNRELADAVNNIGDGIRKAVKTSMKDEQMKTDLITNVSHDIKTPLTSIINYVDLLKRLKIEEEPAKGYIDILDGKAHRLKQLTDDLVEASKISSGNIELNREKLNLAELLKQSIGEFSERLEEKGLQIIFEQGDKPAYIYADSRRMWRVAENLFNNICKYALDGTRVYIDIELENGRIEASVKNISKQQMNIRPDELTERFIRGDSSRSTEGSGLGLSIAKSLVQVQGGSFEIMLDGDLFKIVIGFPEYVEEQARQSMEEVQKQ